MYLLLFIRTIDLFIENQSCVIVTVACAAKPHGRFLMILTMNSWWNWKRQLLEKKSSSKFHLATVLRVNEICTFPNCNWNSLDSIEWMAGHKNTVKMKKKKRKINDSYVVRRMTYSMYQRFVCKFSNEFTIHIYSY